MSYCRQQKRCVDWGSPTLARFGAEVHYAGKDGWDVMIPSGPMQGWHTARNGFELATLAEKLGESVAWKKVG